MSVSLRQDPSSDVVGKVLRRAEVARMARKLQDRLALASYKAQHGQENLSFKDVEARLENAMNRNRPGSGVESASTCSSSSFEQSFFAPVVASSPLTVPIFSDDLYSSGNTRFSRKRNAFQSADEDMEWSRTKRPRRSSMTRPGQTFQSPWKSTHVLPQSSPVRYRRNSRFSTSHGPNISFASEVSTVPASPPFGAVSEEEDDRLPTKPFPVSRASPPRTPPPTRSRQGKSGSEGADLLLYLAKSPSPANPGPKSSRVFAPSTPPSRNQNLPSSLLGTPGMTGFSTPGQQFNFADFVNITPSPAQGAFGNRTPGLTRTPLAAKEARRRLNFDNLVPPSGSPVLSNIGRGAMNKDSGLGMELGGDLVS